MATKQDEILSMGEMCTAVAKRLGARFPANQFYYPVKIQKLATSNSCGPVHIESFGLPTWIVSKRQRVLSDRTKISHGPRCRHPQLRHEVRKKENARWLPSA